MHRVGAGLAGRVEDVLHHEVRLRRWGRADAHSFVREADVERVGVGIGVDGHGRDAPLAAGPQDADGDLPAVGDEQFADRSGCHHVAA